MTALRIVPPEEARRYVGVASEGIVVDLAHTAAVLGEQRQAVLELHSDSEMEWLPWCAECNSRYPCPTARAIGVEA